MTMRRLFAAEAPGSAQDAPEGAPLGGTRSEAMQRVQVGIVGISAMVLLVGLASIIGSQADLVEEAAVPDAAPTTEPSTAPPQRDPLADAGVVPPTEPEPEPRAEQETDPHLRPGPAPANGPLPRSSRSDAGSR